MKLKIDPTARSSSSVVLWMLKNDWGCFHSGSMLLGRAGMHNNWDFFSMFVFQEIICYDIRLLTRHHFPTFVIGMLIALNFIFYFILKNLGNISFLHGIIHFKQTKLAKCYQKVSLQSNTQKLLLSFWKKNIFIVYVKHVISTLSWIKRWKKNQVIFLCLMIIVVLFYVVKCVLWLIALCILALCGHPPLAKI